MRIPPKRRSTKSADDFRTGKRAATWSLRASLATAGIVSVVTLLAAAGAWAWLNSSDHGPHAGGGLKAAPPSATGHLTIAEMAALALLEGAEPKVGEKPAGSATPNHGGGEVSPRERALLAVIENGSDAEVLAALRELASLGGAANHQRLAAVMSDNGRSDAVRTAAAQALLKTGNESDARLAVRALGVIGGDGNTEALDAIAKNAMLPEALRLEAALGLGTIATPRAGNALIAAFGTFTDPAVQEQLLGALGHFPFPQIEDTWQQFLNDPTTPEELRVAAVDALSNSSAESLPYLKTLAGTDPDPNVREIAAWAISTHGESGAMGPDLALMAAAEPEADVRRRLYEAMLVQADNPAANLLSLVLSETDVAARVAGFNALGDAVKRGAPPTVAAVFDGQMVPELTDIALSQDSLNIRVRAVFALRRADTPAALQALMSISQTQTPQIALAALHGLGVGK